MSFVAGGVNGFLNGRTSERLAESELPRLELTMTSSSARAKLVEAIISRTQAALSVQEPLIMADTFLVDHGLY